MYDVNRRWFFGLLAAAALLPKRAVGKAFRAGRMIPRPTVTAYAFRIVEEDIFGRTRICEQRWESDAFVTRLPVAFRRATGSKIRTTTTLSKGRYRHICRWIESTAFNWRTVKVGEIKSSPGLLWNITDGGLGE